MCRCVDGCRTQVAGALQSGMANKNAIVNTGDGGWRMFGSLAPAALFLAP